MIHATPGSDDTGAFAAALRPMVVVARNAIPVAGVIAFGWSPSFVVFALWLDGASALALMLALQTYGFARNDPADAGPWLVPFWLFLVALLGAPYWFMALAFGQWAFPGGFVAAVPGDGPTLAALLLILAGNTAAVVLRRYDRMTDAAIRRDFDGEYVMHLARAGAIMLVAFFLPVRYAVVGFAIALAWIEIFPRSALRLLGGGYLLPTERPERGG